jgi:uncharacterized protein
MRFWDSSAVVPLLVEQDATEWATGLVHADEEMAVWWATRVECASAIARLERDGMLSDAEAEIARARLAHLAPTWDEVQPTEPVRQAALRLLRLHPLRASDALQGGAAIVLSEHDPASLDVVCLDGRLTGALRRECFAVHQLP